MPLVWGKFIRLIEWLRWKTLVKNLCFYMWLLVVMMWMLKTKQQHMTRPFPWDFTDSPGTGLHWNQNSPKRTWPASVWEQGAPPTPAPSLSSRKVGWENIWKRPRPNTQSKTNKTVWMKKGPAGLALCEAGCRPVVLPLPALCRRKTRSFPDCIYQTIWRCSTE